MHEGGAAPYRNRFWSSSSSFATSAVNPTPTTLSSLNGLLIQGGKEMFDVPIFPRFNVGEGNAEEQDVFIRVAQYS